MKKLFIISIFLFNSVISFSKDTTLYFPVTHHIVTNTTSTATMQDASLIPEIMAELNRAFAPAGIQFYMSCVGIDTIRKDFIYNCMLNDYHNYLTDSISVLNTINIYYVNSINNNSNITGFSTFPNIYGYDYIIVTQRKLEFYGSNSQYTSLKDFGTVIHEMGHYFNLEHTFNNWDHKNANAYFREHPTDRTNCLIAGDYFCDTPADIGDINKAGYYEIYNDVNGCKSCSLLIDSFQADNILISKGLIPLGWWYKPDIHNYMNYASNYCRAYFSEDQSERMVINIYDYAQLYNKLNNSLASINLSVDNTTTPLYTFCSGDTTIPKDTIFYKPNGRTEKCIDSSAYSKIYFPIINTDTTAIMWTINNEVVQYGMQTDGLYFYFPLSDYDSLWNTSTYTDDYIIVEAKLQNEEKYIFKFKVYDNSEIVSQLSKYWEDAELDFELVGNTANLNIDLTNTVTIPLPSLPDCQLEINMADSVDWNSDSDNITISPTEVCDFTGQLRYNCECNGFINLNIHNTDCDDPCKNIEWTVTSYLDKDTCGNRIVTVSATISDTSRKIVKAEHGRYDSYYDNYSIEEVYEYPDGVLTTSRTFSLGCYSTSGEWYPFDPEIEHNEFKIILDNGKECSKVFPYGYGSGICCRTFLEDMIAHPNPDINGNIIVNCKFSSMPQSPIILSIIEICKE